MPDYETKVKKNVIQARRRDLQTKNAARRCHDPNTLKSIKKTAATITVIIKNSTFVVYFIHKYYTHKFFKQ